MKIKKFKKIIWKQLNISQKQSELTHCFDEMNLCHDFYKRQLSFKRTVKEMIRKKVEPKMMSQGKDTMEAELRVKKDIQNFEERKQKYGEVANASLQFPKDGNLGEFYIVIKPRQTSYYRNSKITFVYIVPDNFPYKPPTVKCKDRIFHPNIDENNNVCLSLLKEGWQANQELIQVVYGLLQILESLNPEDIEKPLYARAAQIMNKDKKQFQDIVERTLKGQTFEGRKYDNVWLK